MPDVYKVFAILHMMSVGIWINHHTASVTIVDLDFGKSAAIFVMQYLRPLNNPEWLTYFI